MEESIGYEALYPSEEWESLDLADWHNADDLPDGSALDVKGSHDVTIYNPEDLGSPAFEIECDSCGVVGTSSSRSEAEAIGRLHEEFEAVLVDKWAADAVRPHEAFVVEDGSRFEVICSHCGDVGSADDRETADMLRRFHDHAFALASKAVAR